MLNLSTWPELRLSRRGLDMKIDWISSLRRGMKVRNNSLDRVARFVAQNQVSEMLWISLGLVVVQGVQVNSRLLGAEV